MQNRIYCPVSPWIRVGLWSSGLLGLAIIGFALASLSMTAFAAQGGSTQASVDVKTALTPKVTAMELISDGSPQAESIAHAALLYASFWDTGDPTFARWALATSFIDRTLPEGRAQGISGPLDASKTFSWWSVTVRLCASVLMATLRGPLVNSVVKGKKLIFAP